MSSSHLRPAGQNNGRISQSIDRAICNGARACSGGPNWGYLYFGGKLIAEPNGSGVLADRLGSVRSGISYYPWGEEKTSSQDGQVKFATYFRDMPGQDYADQRYYSSNAGRFYTPDPSTGVDFKNPITWNKYAYAGDDPVNFNDPTGRLPCDVSGVSGNDGGSGCGGYSEWWFNGTATAFNRLPDPTCVYSGPEAPWYGGGLSDVPCWNELDLVDETLSDLGKNVEEIAATAVSATDLASLINVINQDEATEFAQLTAQVAPTSGQQPGKAFFNGGHFNLVLQTDQITGALLGDFSKFVDLFGGGGFLGSHNDAVWGDAAKGDFTLHSHQNSNNTFNFHFDLYNPLDVPVGTIGHLFGDVIGSHIGGRCLDPAWR